MPELFIDGEWTSAGGGATREIRCPADGGLVATVDEAGRDDAGAAVDAARRAFGDGPWRSWTPADRGLLLHGVANRLEADAEDVARAESLDTGKRLVESRIDVADVISVFRYYGDLAPTIGAREVEHGQPGVRSTVVSEPVGVCALITPWNFPLLQTSWKVAPALAAGTTLCLKPSELTPSTAILLTRMLVDLGVPAGVVNLVLGAGAEAGATLVDHPDVDLVSFTGGLETGRRIMASAAATVKKIALELGGKNPNVVFADANFEAAVDFALTAIFLDSGQVCSAGARLVLEERLHDRFVDEVVRRADGIRLGGPFDPDAHAGPLISAAHLAKVEAYVAKGVAEGAVIRCGGERPAGGELSAGYFYRPTVLDGCHTGMTVAQEESFGPVLTVETFRTEDDAVRIANDTRYGLAGAVWTEDAAKAERVAAQLRHGTIWINDYHPYVPQAEWGGFNQSGVGRELGPTGLAEYLEHKHIWRRLESAPDHWFL